MKADVFALGIIIFIFKAGIPPFLEASSQDQYYVALCKKPNAFWQFHSSQRRRPQFSPSFVQLISRMLAYKEEERFSIDDVAQSDWFREPYDEAAAKQSMALRIQETQRLKQQSQQEGATAQRGSALELLSEEYKQELRDFMAGLELKVLPLNSALPCHFRLRAESREELLSTLTAAFVKLKVNFVKQDGAGESLCSIKLDGSERRVFFCLKAYQCAEKVFGVDVLNTNSDYFEFKEAKQAILAGLNELCAES